MNTVPSIFLVDIQDSRLSVLVGVQDRVLRRIKEENKNSINDGMVKMVEKMFIT
jgi:hypothetical protein